MQSSASQRVAAVDVFRSLTMFFMLFVNDIPGLKDVPHWLMHARMDEDMMGFSDTIFPAFLFCLGMSVPLAVQHRLRKGDTGLRILGHAAERTVALIVMGLFTLNVSEVGALSYAWFSVLMVLGIFLTWNVYPPAEGARRFLFRGLKGAGIVLLLYLIIYKDLHGSPFRQSWWGILGLIGWTYAVCAVTYLLTGPSLRRNAVAAAAFGLLALGSHSSLIPADYGCRAFLLPFVPSDWTLHAFGMAGMLTTLVMQRYADRLRPSRFIGMLCGAGVVMLALALWCHPHWIISKIQATPTWLFYGLAIYLPLFALLYWLTDVRGKAEWFRLLRPAGTATLTCYMLPYLWYSVQQLLGWYYPEALCSGVPGLLRSLVYAFAVVCLAGGLARIHIKLKI